VRISDAKNLGVCIPLIFFLFGLMMQASADFTTFHGDNQRTGNVSGNYPDEPHVLWSASPTGHGYIGATAAISGIRVYISNWPDMTFKGELGLACLDEENGTVLWLNSLGGKGGASTPAISDDRVFVGSLTGDLYCLNSTTGKTLWNRTLDKNPGWWGVASSPLVQGETVYVMSFSDGAIHSLDLDGKEMWNMTTGRIHPFASAASSGRRLYFPGGDPALYCIDATSGELVWKAPQESQITATPALWNDLAFIVTEKALKALNASTGQEIWKVAINGTMSSPAISFDRVYVGSDDGSTGHLACFNAQNGSQVWRTEVNGPVRSSPLVGDGKVYFGTNTEAGVIYSLNASNGSVAWSYPVHQYVMASAAGSDGVIFIGSDDGLLYAFGFMPKGHLRNGDIQHDDESVKFNITAHTTRPNALFITVGNHPQIEVASQNAALNVTLAPPTNVSNLSSYDLIFLEMLGAEDVSNLAPLIEDAKKKGVPVIILNSGGYEDLGNVNLSDHPKIQEYWDYSGIENMRRLYSYLAARILGLNVKVEEPVPTPKEYIYHPDSAEIFDNLSHYLDWYENKPGHRYNQSAPTIGILSYYTDLGQIDINRLISALEREGANVIGAGFSNTSTIKRLFFKNGTPIVNAVILTKSFRINYGDADQGVSDLEDLNVPVLRAMRLYYQTAEQWTNASSIEPIELYFQVAQPEMDGVIEPIVISGRDETIYAPVESQIEWIAERALAWAELERKPESDRKLAIIYYNHAAGKDNLEGCYLNVPRTLENILEGLNRSLFKVQGSIPDEKDLVDLLAHEGTNIGSWAPGELLSMVDKGNATLIPAEEYLSWFETLPANRQEETIKHWGPPPGDIMVYQNESGKYIVIPKLSFGNVILLPQPTRGWLENNTVLYHSTDLPPHHQYIAFYLWLKNGFGADAIVHLGKHGTQEWLPGKECGISRDDWPALLIQDLPVVYPYIVDNIAEGTQAKRRGDAVMVTHLTPPIVASGLYGNLTNLAQTVFEYKSVQNASVKEGYKRQIINISRDMHLDEDLEVDLNLISSNSTSFDVYADDLERYLYDLKNQFMPYGLHTFGKPPEGRALVGMVKSMLGEGLSKEVAHMISYSDYPNITRLDKENELENCETKLLSLVVINGTLPDYAQMAVLNNVSRNLSDQLNLSLAYAQNIRACQREVRSLVSALDSNYTSPSPADDPIRDPEVLPTGRNFRSLDPRRVPTSAAWEVGKNLAEKIIEEYRQDHNGTFPRKLAMVLWAWAMTDHGVVESEILSLIGAKPVYDGYGGVCDVKLVPLSELGRPRIDVVVVPSGLDRDLFPEKLQLIDRAIRLASNDSSTEYSNFIRENSEKIFQELMATGNVSESDARILSTSRIFLEEAGTYGPNLDAAISASNAWENDTVLGNLFIKRMSYIYGDGIWSSKLASGEDLSPLQEDLYKTNLQEVEAAVHHTNSNLYGFIDNDDVLQYLGGIGLAVRTVSGKTPDMYVTDARDPESTAVSSLHNFFSKELRARYYNPQWIKGMMEQGYSGAREMDKFVENLWGWEAMLPDMVSEAVWNEVHDVYVRDKYDLGMKQFFDQNNPWASQALEGRMLETARKCRWHPDQATKADLVREYQRSVKDFGVTCCHHTCGNLLLNEYMSGILPAQDRQDGSRQSDSKPSHKSSSSKRSSPGGASGRFNTTKSSGVGTASAKPVEKTQSASEEVQGMVMESPSNDISLPSISGAPLMGVALVLVMLLFMIAGFRRG